VTRPEAEVALQNCRFRDGVAGSDSYRNGRQTSIAQLVLGRSASCLALLSSLAVRHQNKNLMPTWETRPGCDSNDRVEATLAAGYLSFAPFENFGFSTVPSMWNGNVSFPSISLAPAKRANVFVQKPCLVVIVATP
jgi:hypothetical protein